MSKVRGHNVNCRLHGRHVDMQLVLFLVFSFSCLLIKQVEFMAPIYCESHWITCYVDDAFKRSYLCMPRSRFYSYHMPVILLFLPLQRYEKFWREDLHVIVCPWCGVAYYVFSIMFVNCSVASLR